MFRRIFICLFFAVPVTLRPQSMESFLTKNFGRIVEVATPSGALVHYHNLIGYDSNGLVRRASFENTYKIFGATPAQSDLNSQMNPNNRFGSPGSHDCYEIRYGIDSSRYWINTQLAPNHLPFAVYNVGPRAADNPSVTGGIKLCLRVQDDDGNGIYTPGERLFAFGDLALPIDSSYEDTISHSLTFPFSITRSYFSLLRTGNASIPYTATTFTVATDGALPPAGTVLRLIAQTADTSLPWIYMPDSLIAFSNRRYAYPFSYYSFETPALNLINAPAGMVLSGDSIIWNVSESQLGQEYSFTLEALNNAGITSKTLFAKALAPDPVIAFCCNNINTDTIYDAMLNLQNFGTRFLLADNHREVAEWIKNKFIQIGYPNTVIDSFYRTDYIWPWGSGQHNASWQYNVIATLPGTIYPDSVYIVGGHYDSYSSGDPLLSAPGADDNASGTVAAIEIARVFKKFNYQPRHTIKFIAFAAEELMLQLLPTIRCGSMDYAVKARNSNERIQYMINNDMISYCPNMATDWKVAVHNYPTTGSVKQSALLAINQYTTLGYSFLDDSQYSDSYPFYDQGYPAIYFEEFKFNPYYHTINETLAYCNLDYMKEMTKISMALLMTHNGTETTVGVEEKNPVASGYALYGNYPNPFNPSTVISYQLAINSKVSLKIYNTLGQEVRTLVSAVQNTGLHSVSWDGKDNVGRAVSSGIYIYRLQAGNFVKSNKMTLMR